MTLGSRLRRSWIDNARAHAWSVALLFALTPACVGGVKASGPTDAPRGLVVAPEPESESESEPSELVSETLVPGAPEHTVGVAIDATRRYQILEGFGAAVAWHQGRLVGNVSDEVYTLLFPDLGLDILRFRNRFERSDHSDGNLAEEVTIFERATRALGHAPKLLLSSWSPPAALKANGKERCANNPNCTLAKHNGSFVYGEFADWWARSLSHYAGLGLVPDFISIQNEPDFIPGNWEGCKFTPEESNDYPAYGKALAAVHERLVKLPKRPRLLGPEVLGIHYHRIPNYLAALDQTLLDGVAHHIYERGNDNMWDWRSPGPDSFLDEMTEVRDATALPTFQTEFNTDEDHGVDGGFETAWLIHHTLVTQGAVAFLYWDLIWSGNKGLVSLIGLTAKPRDHYYALRHFARFTEPGFTRVAATSDDENLLASAYVSPDGRQVTLVLLNTADGVASVSLQPPGEADSVEAYLTTFRPGHSQRWQSLTLASGQQTGAIARLPARSVATLVYSGLR